MQSMPPPSNGDRILVVDDEAMNRETLRRRLERRGYVVHEAEGGEAALKMIDEQPFDCVLLDIMMPDVGGLEVLERVRARWGFAQLPVIMATAKAEDVVAALERGANDFVTKPINFPALLARVRNHIAIKRYEEQLRHATRAAEQAAEAKGMFLANMSHELRTPLNSVIGFANVMRKKGGLDSQQTTYVERIRDNGEHLLELIDKILDLAKLEAGHMEVERSKVQLASLVRKTLRELEGRVLEKDLELLADLPPDLPEMETDADKLKQVLVNLVGNSIKFTEAGKVTVRAETRGGRVHAVEVRDTGIGIPEGRLGVIFEAFQQADNSTRREFGGTGLGLAICRQFCELLGARLEVESEVGEGSTFRVIFDAPEDAPQP